MWPSSHELSHYRNVFIGHLVIMYTLLVISWSSSIEHVYLYKQFPPVVLMLRYKTNQHNTEGTGKKSQQLDPIARIVDSNDINNTSHTDTRTISVLPFILCFANHVL